MSTLEESIAMAMDCDTAELVPFLPYILQDFFEIGSSATSIVDIIKEQKFAKKVKVLDLGCGKGAVTIKIAEDVESECLGVDGVKEFIELAKSIVEKRQLANCRFECGDIRNIINKLGKYDLIILGSIGPVFGNYYETMIKLKHHLESTGFIILDDGYISDENNFNHDLVGTKNELLNQLEMAGMEIYKEYLGDNISNKNEYAKQFKDITRRCNEMKNKFPDKKDLFEGYIAKQKSEYENLANEIICSTMLIKKLA